MEEFWIVALTVLVFVGVLAALVLVYRRSRRKQVSVDLSALQMQYAPGVIEINRQATVDAQLPVPRATAAEVHRP